MTALIIALVIGAIAGWLAGLLVQGTGFGLLGDIVVGIVGAMITSLLFPKLGIGRTLGGGMLAPSEAGSIAPSVHILVEGNRKDFISGGSTLPASQARALSCL